MAREPALYCPRCQTEGRPGAGVCESCLGSLERCGYCPICERGLIDPPGATCPKHDVELLDAAEAPPDGLESTRLVTVATYGLPSEAQGPRLRLEAEGIPVFLQDERIGSQTLFNVATGGLKLQVPAENASDARILLSQVWDAPVADDDLDDDWEGLASYPGERRRRVMRAMILVILLGPIVLAALMMLAAQLR